MLICTINKNYGNPFRKGGGMPGDFPDHGKINNEARASILPGEQNAVAAPSLAEYGYKIENRGWPHHGAEGQRGPSGILSRLE
jgi:hypothetical protein